MAAKNEMKERAYLAAIGRQLGITGIQHMSTEQLREAVEGKPKPQPNQKEVARMSNEVSKNGNGKQAVAGKVKAGKANVPLAEVKKAEPAKLQPAKANGKKGTQILLDTIRKAGRIGLTQEEIITKCEKLLPNKDPKGMILKTLKPYFVKKGWVKMQGDRFIIAEKK